MVWWVDPIIRYSIQIISCASAKNTLNNVIMELVRRLTNISRYSGVGGIQGLGQL